MAVEWVLSAFEEGNRGTLVWAQDLHVGMLFTRARPDWGNTQVKLDVSASSSVTDLYFFEGELGLPSF